MLDEIALALYFHCQNEQDLVKSDIRYDFLSITLEPKGRTSNNACSL